jgi:hypothetical protein
MNDVMTEVFGLGVESGIEKTAGRLKVDEKSLLRGATLAGTVVGGHGSYGDSQKRENESDSNFKYRRARETAVGSTGGALTGYGLITMLQHIGKK